MRDPIILLVHLIATLARLMGPGGLRSVVAESVLGYVAFCVQNRLRKKSGHGKRLIVEVDLLTKECSHDHSNESVPRSPVRSKPSSAATECCSRS